MMLNKILCVEDSRFLQIFLENKIEKTDFAEKMISVFNGQEALSYYQNLLISTEDQRAGYPELIFLDLDMPVMGGLEFLDIFEEQFLDHFPLTKIVILTSSEELIEIAKARQCPVILDYLIKPLTSEMLFDLKKSVSSQNIHTRTLMA